MFVLQGSIAWPQVFPLVRLTIPLSCKAGRFLSLRAKSVCRQCGWGSQCRSRIDKIPEFKTDPDAWFRFRKWPISSRKRSFWKVFVKELRATGARESKSIGNVEIGYKAIDGRLFPFRDETMGSFLAFYNMLNKLSKHLAPRSERETWQVFHREPLRPKSFILRSSGFAWISSPWATRWWPLRFPA